MSDPKDDPDVGANVQDDDDDDELPERIPLLDWGRAPTESLPDV